MFFLLLWLQNRNECVRDWIDRIEKHDGGLKDFSQAYKYYGLHFQQDNSVIAREWAPGAVQVYLTGDFSKFRNVFFFFIFWQLTFIFFVNFAFLIKCHVPLSGLFQTQFQIDFFSNKFSMRLIKIIFFPQTTGNGKQIHLQN